MSTLADQVRAAQGGDREAFHALVLSYQDFAWGLALARTGDAQVAREVAQESFLTAWLKLAQLRRPAAFGAWLRRIVTKQADRVTRRASPQTIAWEAAPSVPTPQSDVTEQLADHAQMAMAMAALRTLPEHEQAAATLFYLSGEPVAAVATFLDLNVGTVKKRLHSARNRLKKEVEVMLRDTLDATRPSQDDALARSVRFFIAARTGDQLTARTLLALDPELAKTPEPQHAGEAYHPIGARSQMTALHLAVHNGHLPVVRALLQAGADGDAPTKAGHTPLHYAVMVDQVEIAQALLEAGADPNSANARGVTPLHIAAMRGREAITALLLNAGADVDAQDANGHTAAVWSARLRDRVAGAPKDAQADIDLDDPAVYWTGIKAIDLFCPLPRAGTARVDGGHHIGMMVLLGEMMHHHGSLRGRRCVFAAPGERLYDASEVEPIVREVDVSGRAVARWLPAGAPADTAAGLLERALEEADGLVLVDHLIARNGLGAPPEDALLLAFQGWEKDRDPEALPGLGDVSATISLSPELAAAGLYPAVDPLRSTSEVPIGPRHQALADAARALLRDAPEGTRATVLRAWLTQPFAVAEAHNAFPGALVSIERTLDELESVLSGAWDEVDPRSLRYKARLGEDGLPRAVQ